MNRALLAARRELQRRFDAIALDQLRAEVARLAERVDALEEQLNDERHQTEMYRDFFESVTGPDSDLDAGLTITGQLIPIDRTAS